jgi:hypothetical protein
MYRLRTILLMAFAAACLTFAASAHGQCTRCCFPSSNVTVSPTTAQGAQSVIVTTVLLNCSVYPRVLTATVSVTPNNAACGHLPRHLRSALTSCRIGRAQSRTRSRLPIAAALRDHRRIQQHNRVCQGDIDRELSTARM